MAAAPFTCFSSFFICFFLFSSLPLRSACPPPKSCGKFNISFPFSRIKSRECGPFYVNCTDVYKPTVQFDDPNIVYVVKDIQYERKEVRIQYLEFFQSNDVCSSLPKFMAPPPFPTPLQLKTPYSTFVSCDRHDPNANSIDDIEKPSNCSLCHDCCNSSDLYYCPTGPPNRMVENCIVIDRVPLSWDKQSNPPDLHRPYLQKCLEEGFVLQWNHKGGKDNVGKSIGIGLGAGIGCLLLVCLLFFISQRYRTKLSPVAFSTLLSRGTSSDPYSRSEHGQSSPHSYTQVFTYKELSEATNNFNPSKELGDGGFGIVYHGKLWDGRSVAVKRLYRTNYRRTEQFHNEIDILSRLRHPNLVVLYGYGSCDSRELFLVYEFIPNGTVADHLHGDRMNHGILTWPIRLRIAIETADAMAYLHNVEIIHRDIKTDNILLDSKFRVKVADFGLSRLFPFDVSHVSTTPQGTPGYLDPDYHRCYQLTLKSDVYSFGVVLIELISSLTAVDITRPRQEINLANMAICKIHNGALQELVDPTLGFDKDFVVRRMITLVAELACMCLQDEKEARPSMDVVLVALRAIENQECMTQWKEEMGISAADRAILEEGPPL